LENAIYFDRAEQYRFEANAERDRFKLLLDVNNALVSQLDPHELWTSLLTTLRRHLHHDYASVVVLDRESGTLQLEAATYYDARGVLEPQAPMLERSPVAQALDARAPRIFQGDEIDR